MADQITPIDYAYRIRSKARKAHDQAKEAKAPKELVEALKAAKTIAEAYAESLSSTEAA